jgi:hypothetical protein
MANKGVLTKVLAVIGTVFAWLPILATILTGGIVSLVRGEFQVDYLMPAELFPAVLTGGALLLWAALRARSRRALVGESLGAATALWFGMQAVAEVTGLASGRTGPVGWPWWLVISALALYTVSVVALGVAGVLLLRALSRRGEQVSPSSRPNPI